MACSYSTGEHSVPVEVVDGVAPVVLNVPAERGEDHPHVEPGDLHPRDVSVDVAQQRLLQHGHHVQVPAAARVLLQDTRNVS